MLPDTNYRQLAESNTRNRGSTLQTRFADHGGLAERPFGWRRINSGSEYSRHHTRQNESARCCLLLKRSKLRRRRLRRGFFLCNDSLGTLPVKLNFSETP